MQWAAPIAGLVAAGLAVPLLVLMYFLKLRRRRLPVSSSLLWKRAVQDLQVNAPFQRLRRNILLLLQLLALIAALVALAGPILLMRSGPGRRYVLLIDRSASMNATDVDAGTRLDEAKRRARRFVGTLRRPGAFSLGETDMAMVVAFSSGAKLMCNFTSDRDRLLDAIDAIDPTDESTTLDEAMTVAQAFARPAGEGAEQAPESLATIELFSDGRIAESDAPVLGDGEVNFHRVGSSGANVAVVAMEARRSYERADEAEVFVALGNYGRRAMRRDVQLSLDGAVRSVRRVTIPPARDVADDEPPEPGKTAVAFSLTHPEAGVLEARILPPPGERSDDPLAVDDAGWAVLPAPRRLSALLVTAHNPPLRSALEACPLARLDVRSPEAFAADVGSLGAGGAYDAIVLDAGALPPDAELPRGRYLVFGRPPAVAGAKVRGTLENQTVIDWRARHPVLQFANLEGLFAAECVRFDLPRGAELLAEFDGRGANLATETPSPVPAIGLVRRRASTFLLVSFDAMRSNWPFEPSFVMFCYNAVTFLATESGGERRTLRVGEPIVLDRLPTGASAVVEGPDGHSEPVEVQESGALRYPGTDRAGVYRVTVTGGGGRSIETFAAGVLDERESRIAPAEEVVLAGRSVAASDSPASRGNVPIWPWLATAALALVCVEWVVYVWKLRI